MDESLLSMNLHFIIVKAHILYSEPTNKLMKLEHFNLCITPTVLFDMIVDKIHISSFF